jgi:hypothetical protein
LCQKGSKNAHRRTEAQEVNEAVMECLTGLVAYFHDDKIVELAHWLENA